MATSADQKPYVWPKVDKFEAPEIVKRYRHATRENQFEANERKALGEPAFPGATIYKVWKELTLRLDHLESAKRDLQRQIDNLKNHQKR